VQHPAIPEGFACGDEQIPRLGTCIRASAGLRYPFLNTSAEIAKVMTQLIEAEPKGKQPFQFRARQALGEPLAAQSSNLAGVGVQRGFELIE
jgi:hypothetical protein